VRVRRQQNIGFGRKRVKEKGNKKEWRRKWELSALLGAKKRERNQIVGSKRRRDIG